MNIILKKIFITFLFLMYLIPGISFAADVFFSADKTVFTTDENFIIQVLINTKDVSVNAFEGTIIFPDDILELKEIRDGNSLVNFWIEKPHSIGSKVIVFSGITTGGFSGSNGFLFSLVFNSKKIGNGSIVFDNIKVLQNDGLGTNTSIKNIPFIFSITNKSDGSKMSDLTIKDTNPPEDFTPFIANDPAIFDGQHFLVFSTVDKGTGIDHYEVRESTWFLFGILGGKYINTESPYLLKDQTLKNKIYIKAVDKAGNEKLVKLGAQNPSVMLEQYLILGIILIICLFIFKKICSKYIRL